MQRIFVLIVLLGISALPVQAQQASVHDRLDRLEQLLDNQGLLDLLHQVEELQSEIRELRGELEVQAHQIETLRKQQRMMVSDLDSRMGSPAMSAPPVTAGENALPAGSLPKSQPNVAPLVIGAAPVSPAEKKIVVDAKGQAQYEAALTLLKQGRYDEAINGFNDFLDRYSGSTLGANAQYWLGECYYVTRRFDQAMDAFRQVVQGYPASGKVPDAQLKIGFIQYERRDWKGARAGLSELVNRYPGTTVARLAATRLQRMDKEGR